MSSVRRRPGRPEKDLPSSSQGLLSEKSKEIDPGEFGREHWSVVALSVLFLVLISGYLHRCLPNPLEPNSKNTQFSEIRARKILKELSDFGPKPAGSYACEGLTRKRIIKELQTVQTTASNEVNYEVATQNPSGCFDIPKFDTDGFTICYRNVSNVMVRMGRKENKEGLAIMLNCHYDSWPTSSGGSDDLISCALMIELVRLLANKPEKLKHDVIFLFNGAEESSLQAAHGFITQHPWRHSVRAFINLEASGSGGRELLFQAGPSNQWLLNSYLTAAVHPHCSVLGQEVFQSGVYPGDTDFRVFRDYGRVPGLDLAFVQNGYWWHTEFDEEKRITSGSLQRAGENVYSTLCHLLNSPYIEKPAEYGDKKSVFFDFLGLFVVVYSIQLAHWINIAIIIATVVASVLAGTSMARALVHYIAVVISMVGMTYCMIKMGSYFLGVLSWYSNHWVAPVVYGVPVAWVGASTMTFLVTGMRRRDKLNLATSIENVHFCVISAILAVCTYYDIASGFLFALQALPILKKALPLSEGWLGLVCHAIFAFPGLSMAVYTTQMLLSIFIPIMGRTSGNPEPVVASFVAFSAILIVLNMLPLLIRSKPVRDSSEKSIAEYIRMLVGVIMAVVVLLYIVATINGTPYRYKDIYPTTKRTQFFHSNRLFRNEDGSLKSNDTVIYAISHDHRGAEDIPFVNRENDFAPLTCSYNDPYCEIPFYFPTRHRVQERHIRFKYAADRIKFPKETEIRVLETEETAEGVKYSMEVTGSGQISVYLIGQQGWFISNCSLSEEARIEEHMFLYFTCSGDDCATWNFDIQMQGPKTTSPRLLAGVASHYLHGPSMQSNSLKEIVKTIESQREEDHTWAITASAWNIDLVYQFVR